MFFAERSYQPVSFKWWTNPQDMYAFFQRGFSISIFSFIDNIVVNSLNNASYQYLCYLI